MYIFADKNTSNFCQNPSFFTLKLNIKIIINKFQAYNRNFLSKFK